MERVKFNKCLNKEVRFYNISVGSIFGASFGVIMWALKGILYGFATGIIGAILGGWLMKQYWLGDLQKWFYWNLPFTKQVIGKSVPKSHHRNLL